MWEAILGVIIFGFLSGRFMWVRRQSRRKWLYIIGSIMTGLACLENCTRLGHLLGFWSFTGL
jgi:hypothetical protein